MSCELALVDLKLLSLTMASYLAISDFYPIGGDQRYSASSDLGSVSASAEEATSGLLDRGFVKGEDELNELELIRTEQSRSDDDSSEIHRHAVSSRESTSPRPKKRKKGTASLDLHHDSLSRAGETKMLCETATIKMTRGRGHNGAQPRSSGEPLSRACTPNIPLPQQSSTKARASHERVPSTLQLSNLASITGNNATRNKQVNILAMVEYVSTFTVKPTTAPLKRDVRIMDPSTDKKVTLSVFVDPVNFIPKEEDIILFRNLTTHDFSGGNLNAYPKNCRGKEWYILNPYDIEECDMKSMEVFRARYRKTMAQRTGQ